MANTTPFIVSVLNASSFMPGANVRKYKTKVVWVNNAPNANVRALSAHDIHALKKTYGYDPLEDVSPPRSRGVSGGNIPNGDAFGGGISDRAVSGGDGSIDRYAINLSVSAEDGHDHTSSAGDARDMETARPVAYADTGVSADVSAGTSAGDEADEFTLESLGEALDSGTRTAREKEVRRMFQARYAPSKQLTFAREIIVVKDIWVLAEDNLNTLKRKIQLATGIPTYRQHLWYEQNGMVISPCYLLWNNDSRVDINIWDLRAQESIVNGIPVNTHMYADRAALRVRNNEFSATLESMSLDCETSPPQWFVVDINDFITNREQLAGTIRNDIHVRELIYFGMVLQYWPAIPAGVFQTFISNEPLLHDEYPELAPSESLLQRQLLTETSIVAANPEPKIKNQPLSVYLVESDIGIINEYYAYGGVVNLHALFNSFLLSKEIPYMTGRFSLGGRIYTLVKTYSAGRVPSKKRHIPVDTICILYILPELAEMLVYIHTSGIYHSEVIWREDTRTDVDSARSHTIEATNHIIEHVNSLGEVVVARPLVLMSQTNISIINTSIIMSIAHRLGNAEFEGLKENAQLFKRANLINITSSEPSIFVFHFFKGMHSYDDARFDVISNTLNGYEYSTSIIVQQRWEGIYMRQKLVTITSRSTDIYIRASGLKYSEYSPFIKFMLMLIEMPIVGKTKPGVVIERGVKAISQLKELDPLLYDLKKIYGNKIMYSQICQKPNQPIIVDKPGPKSVKYWNFTKKEVAYYECPSEKYHALYFKTGVHPAGFCIPCCKKISIASGSKHDKIFATCMKEHTYEPASRGETQSRSGYIISYSPEIEPGRLSYLPESSLDQLFYQQFSAAGCAVDTECIPELGYYIFGINQDVLNTHRVGMVASIAHALGIPIHDFVTETSKKILEAPSAWELLLSGRIMSYFASAKSFTGELEMLFNSTGGSKSDFSEFNEWNESFIDIARLYWNVNVILFIDSGDGNILIKVPRGIKRADELISSQHKHLFAICAPGNIYHPIYQIDTKVFKKSGTITQTLFSHGDKIIEIVRKMMTSVIAAPTGAPVTGIDLDEAIQWLDSSQDKYTMRAAYINRSNTCYAIQIVSAAQPQSVMYFPVSISLHDHLSISRTNTEFSLNGYNIPFAEINDLLTDFNAWSAKIASKHETNTVAKKIVPAIWLLLGDAIIGFQDESRQYNYYVKSMSIDEARAIMALPMIKLRYDPTEINALINSRPAAVVEPQLGQFLYEHHGYQLFVLEFISSIDRHRNQAVRDRISAIIRKSIKSPSIMFHELHQLLLDWPRDYDHIIAILARFTKSRECTASEYSRLLSNIPHDWSAETVLEVIDQSRFEFDDVIMSAMFDMPIEKITSALGRHLEKIIDISTESVGVAQFPENIITCQTKSSVSPEYCKNQKLRVSARDYKTWSAQLALDIKNPIKQRKLMALMTQSHSSEFSFTSHPGETIYITLG
jgi:hypothetical protein